MSKEKITISEIVDLMASKHHFSKKQTEEFVKMLLSTVEDMLIDGEAVKIKDFGTFKPQWNEPRKSVDVNTGEEITIPGYYKVVFVPENEFKELINKPFSHLKPVEKPADLEEKPEESVNNEPAFEKPKFAMEPMRVFEEQANQIKGLLDEIEAMSDKKRTEEHIEKEEENLIENEDEIEENSIQEEYNIDDNEADINDETGNAIGLEDEKTDKENSNDIDILEHERIEIEEPESIIEPEILENEEKEDISEGNIENDETKTEVEEESEDVENIHFFASYENRRARKLRKKLEREAQNIRRREEIKKYFEENDFNIVREVPLYKQEMPVYGIEEESKDAFPEGFSEDIVSEVESVETSHTNVVEETDAIQATPLNLEIEPENDEKRTAKKIHSDEIKVDENVVDEDEILKESSFRKEIDTIVSEAVSDKSQDKQLFIEENIIEPVEVTSETDYEPETNKNIDEIQQEIQKQKIIEENTYTEKNLDYTFTPSEKNNRRLWWIIIIGLLVLAAGFGVWKSLPYLKSHLNLYSGQQNDRVKNTKMIVPQATIVLPTSKSDSVLSQTADTLSTENIFEKEREYKDFVSSEVIKQGVTLKTLAKKYLGNDAFWIYIYEANIDVIEDPKNVALGTVVRIPKVNPKLINVNNPKCIPYANKLAAEYLYYDNK